MSIYEGLVEDDRFEALVKIEDITNPRLKSVQRITASTNSPQIDSPRLQNWNHAPFAYSNPEGTRFFPPERPCLELADSPQTALAISVERRQNFLARTNEPPIGIDMRMLKTPASGRFIDLRGVEIGLDREGRWKIGATIPTDADGVVYHPPERPSATCIGILKGSVLARSVQTAHYRFSWNGNRITKLYAFDDVGREYEPALLSGHENVIAA
ncbi:RES family NAD+ phosphorylase [Rhodoblastus sp.]|uniref:RES family NAD+ phosphorylase n=1 Tax=Rhodoblastus sp. TaxID=1962975 RepID=UPI0035B02DDC